MTIPLFAAISWPRISRTSSEREPSINHNTIFKSDDFKRPRLVRLPWYWRPNRIGKNFNASILWCADIGKRGNQHVRVTVAKKFNFIFRNSACDEPIRDGLRSLERKPHIISSWTGRVCVAGNVDLFECCSLVVRQEAGNGGRGLRRQFVAVPVKKDKIFIRSPRTLKTRRL